MLRTVLISFIFCSVAFAKKSQPLELPQFDKKVVEQGTKKNQGKCFPITDASGNVSGSECSSNGKVSGFQNQANPHQRLGQPDGISSDYANDQIRKHATPN